MTNRQDTDRAGYDPGVEAPTAPAPEKASLFEDFIDVFYAPSNVYARRQSSSFWPYFWIVSIVSALFTFASRSVMSAIFDAEFSRNMAKAMETNPQLTQDMVNQQRGMMEGIATFGSFLGMPLVILFTAILVLIAAKLVKAQVNWGTALLIAAIAQIPRLLGGLLTTVQGLLIDTTTIQNMHSVGYSPARFMAPDTQPQILGLLGRFDLFTLWVTFLIGIGVAVVGRVPRSKGFVAAGIAWAIVTVIGLVPMLWS